LEIDPAFIAEANQFSSNVRTVPTGEYQLQGHPFDLEVDARDPGQDKRAVPGRKIGRVRFDVYDKAQPTRKLASVFADVSPEAHKVTYKDRTFLDTPSQLWGQAAKAYGVKTNGQVREALGKYPVVGYVREKYKTLAGQYVVPVTEAERVELIEKGAKPYLELRSIKAVS
jgi:hypothetical protein